MLVTGKPCRNLCNGNMNYCIDYRIGDRRQMYHEMPELKLKILIRKMVGCKIEVWDI